jgi:hypothetical protein
MRLLQTESGVVPRFQDRGKAWFVGASTAYHPRESFVGLVVL